ncbi:MAG: hypothetical protein ABNH53_06475 [Henriciella sp.]|jgi:hypothetical protein
MPVAKADTVQRVRFAQSAVVMVWDKQDRVHKGQSVTIGQSDIPAPADFLITGELLPVAASDAIFGNTMTLRLASNSPLILQATSLRPVSNLQIRVTDRGGNAATQPGTLLTDKVMGGLPTDIYSLSSKTATRHGSALSQSIELEISWLGSPEAGLNITALAQ